MADRFNPKKAKYLKIANPILKLFIHEKKSNDVISFEKVKEIVVVEVTLIGDSVINTTFFKAIRHNFPTARITIVGKTWIQDQLKEQHLYDRYIKFDIQKILENPMTMIKGSKVINRVLNEVNDRKYDLAFEPIGDERYIYFMHKIHADRKISYNYTDDAFLMTDPIEPDNAIKSMIDTKLHLLEAIGCQISPDDRIPQLKLNEQMKKDNYEFLVQHNLTDKKIIGIHPGASQKIRQYPQITETVEMVARQLNNKDHYAFIVFCGPHEEDTANEVKKVIDSESIFSLISKEELRKYIYRIAVCDYMICNDSGAGHVTAAYNIPMTVIFGKGDIEKFTPRGRSEVYVVSHDLPCKPCSSPVCAIGTEECIRGIKPEEVAKTVIKMLEEN